MINSIGPTGTGAVDTVRSQGVQKSTAVEKVAVKTEAEQVVPNPAADLAAAGPPVDTDKIAKIRAAIQNGSYSLDIQAIANRMIDIDILPRG
ncbi:flagellar biosynthesis anti-sigma factor FlgM [Sphingomonas solaris]|uniref:Negative regulator of flagellin synthesis n=1 Tax=Alterirhizorhabdus solaris TaxID=2529389 RepID=A0A558QR65_9SPHN|nr:flagellar biosynthesis anti-sigma factor FlgM [Sphingomonas solaris]TVV69631.1 flagellar biosynthesis anti-sigma factor FlgM [Sphingomonas solaris]